MNHAERKHSRLAPSKASTWTWCTASVQLIDRLTREGKIKDVQSAYAKEGEKAHEISEAFLRGEKLPAKHADASDEMLGHCRDYVRYCDQFRGRGVSSQVEMKVPLFYLPEDTGSVDFAAVDLENEHVHIIDLKYGAGVAVSAERNKQLAIYARSYIEKHVAGKPTKRPWKVSLHIYQPRTQEARDTGIPFSRWDLTLDELKLFTEKEIAVPAQLILDDARHLLKFAPGEDTCKWCPSKGDCSARTQWLLDGTPIMRLIEEDILLPAGALTDEEKLKLLQRDKEIRDLLDAVKESLWRSARNGSPVSGTKLVAGRGSREWNDEDDAANYLIKKLGKGKAFTTSLITPAQAEKLLTKKDEGLANLTLHKEGAPILALADDKRREWVDPDKTEFEDLDLQDAIDDAV